MVPGGTNWHALEDVDEDLSQAVSDDKPAETDQDALEPQLGKDSAI